MNSSAKLSKDKLDALSPESLHAYLQDRGWIEDHETTTQRVRVFRYQSEPDAEVCVPRRRDIADYAWRIADALNVLAAAEERSIWEVFVDVSTPSHPEPERSQFVIESRSEFTALPDPKAPRKVFLVIFGGTGDLVRVKLAAAVGSLFSEGCVHPDSVILGVAFDDLDDGEYREFWQKPTTVKPPGRKEFPRGLLERVFYQRADFEGDDWHEAVGARVDDLRGSTKFDHIMFYYAVWSEWYVDVAKGLDAAGLVPEGGKEPSSACGMKSSHYLEKPVGHSYDSAKMYIEGIQEYVHKDDLFLIDDYVAKEAVRDLLEFRHGNLTASPALTNEYINRVWIYAYETVGVEQCGESYDHVGALKDMWIPHLLQLLAVFCCNSPKNNNDLPTKKRKVLESIADIAPADVEKKTVFGQYSYGVGNERSSTDVGDIRPYRQEPGVKHASTTETFCAVELEFDPTRAAENGLTHWCGIPFYLITGKRMHRKETGAWVEFKKADALEKLFEADSKIELCERWNIRFQPFPAILRYHVVKAPGNYNHLGMGRSRYNYVKHYPDEPLRDFATLLREAVAGQNFWFVKANTILESWRIGQSIADFRNDAEHQVYQYMSGDPGPLDAFYKKFGFLYVSQLGPID